MGGREHDTQTGFTTPFSIAILLLAGKKLKEAQLGARAARVRAHHSKKAK